LDTLVEITYLEKRSVSHVDTDLPTPSSQTGQCLQVTKVPRQERLDTSMFVFPVGPRGRVAVQRRHPGLRVLGVLPTLFDSRSTHKRAVLAGVAQRYRLPVLARPSPGPRSSPRHPVRGLTEGDARVIRNAGGVVTAEVIRLLAISQWLLGTREIVLIHHTDCGMLTFTDASSGPRSRPTPGSDRSGRRRRSAGPPPGETCRPGGPTPAPPTARRRAGSRGTRARGDRSPTSARRYWRSGALPRSAAAAPSGEQRGTLSRRSEDQRGERKGPRNTRGDVNSRRTGEATTRGRPMTTARDIMHLGAECIGATESLAPRGRCAPSASAPCPSAARTTARTGSSRPRHRRKVRHRGRLTRPRSGPATSRRARRSGSTAEPRSARS
jgi:hypothetical protein